MKKIRVLHISETFAAGVYTYIKDLCSYFDTQEGFENYVIYSGERQDTDREKFKTDFSANTELIEISMQREISPSKDLKAIREIRKAIKQIAPDIIHLHSSKASVLGQIASRGYKKAIVFYTPNGYSFLREDVSRSKQRLFYFIEKNIRRFFGGTTIACGDTEFEHAQKIGKAHLVRNGVSIEEVAASYREKEVSQPLMLGSMGRISAQKNPELFNQIALGDPESRYIWIGDGELRNVLTAENIQVTGWLPREEALDMINTLDVYMQTSLWEGLPFTVIEAMVLGKPVLATNVVGNKDAVAHGSSGYLQDRPEEFLERINALKADHELLTRLGANSKSRARELFDKNKNFEGVKAIYLKALSA